MNRVEVVEHGKAFKISSFSRPSVKLPQLPRLSRSLCCGLARLKLYSVNLLLFVQIQSSKIAQK